jgi:two-component system, LytTR family, response regulator
LNSIELISSVLKDNFPEVNILGKTHLPIEGIKMINQLNPDLVFLDIEMPQATGFDILETLPDRNFEIIFITAYDKYAVKAFKYSAVDYILKPVDIDEFIMAVRRVIKKKDSNNISMSKFKVLLENLKTQRPVKISIPSSRGYEYVNIDKIIRIEADGRYSTLFLENARTITVTKVLSELIEIIDDSAFFRPHKSHYINLNYVKMFVKAEGSYIEMIDGSQVAISRNKKEEFVNLMNFFVGRHNT